MNAQNKACEVLTVETIQRPAGGWIQAPHAVRMLSRGAMSQGSMFQHRVVQDLKRMQRRAPTFLRATYTMHMRPAGVKTCILTRLMTRVWDHLTSRARRRACGPDQECRSQVRRYVGTYVHQKRAQGISQRPARNVVRMSRNASGCTRCCNVC